ncbi:MAG: response regulator [Butyrivibrio sp.]|nr:response regulator [Butyrivibrio sp.]MBR1641758.1 response regulator [Butyrivibrio sp.]
MAGILIVDDSPVNRNILRNMLEIEGYEVVGEAENGKEGYDKFLDLSPSIIILDISMPQLNGIDLLRLIKSRDPLAKVVMLSANSESEKVSEAARHGADEYVTKPYTRTAVLEAIKRCAESANS